MNNPERDDLPKQFDSQSTPKDNIDIDNPLLEAGKTIILSLFLAFGIRQFIAEPRYIPSESMVPTLEINDRLMVEKLTYHWSKPQRGDVIVFMPNDKLRKMQPELKDAFIKRVIGLPGESVEVKDNTVFVNGKPLAENYLQAKPNYKWGPETVPPNSYLVLGDNRNNSYDSHFWGYVPFENIIGKAAFRFWPLNRFGGINPKPEYQN
jgi:signal peptidase I